MWYTRPISPALLLPSWAALNSERAFQRTWNDRNCNLRHDLYDYDYIDIMNNQYDMLNDMNSGKQTRPPPLSTAGSAVLDGALGELLVYHCVPVAYIPYIAYPYGDTARGPTT